MEKADARYDRRNRIQAAPDLTRASGDVSRLSAGRNTDENFLQRVLGRVGGRKRPLVLTTSRGQSDLVKICGHREQFDASKIEPLAVFESHIFAGAQTARHAAFEQACNQVVGFARACKYESAHRTEIDTPGFRP
jgi:hypothetical protein